MRGLAVLLTVAVSLSACGGSETESVDTSGPPGQASQAAEAASGLRLVQPDDAKATIDDPPENLVVLDVRTAEEFAEGHIDGAIMIDFYRDDFADQLAELDPDVPYVLYCRSGNRSGQTLSIMEGLEFSDVQDVDGGIVGWQSAGLPLVTE